MKNKKQGFTLIELLVVIAIIGVLAAFLVPAVSNALFNAKVTQMLNNGKQIYLSAFDRYTSDPIYGTGEWTFPNDNATYPDGVNVSDPTTFFEALVSQQVYQGPRSSFASPDTAINTTSGGATGEEGDPLSADQVGWSVVFGASPEIAGIPWIFSANIPAGAIAGGNTTYELREFGSKNAMTPKGKAVVIATGGSGVALTAQAGAIIGTQFNPAGDTGSSNLEVREP